MIKSIHFKNFKALRDTTLPLERFTLIIGPNGSGKTTALQGVSALSSGNLASFLPVDADRRKGGEISLTGEWSKPYEAYSVRHVHAIDGSCDKIELLRGGIVINDPLTMQEMLRDAQPIRRYMLNAEQIAAPVKLEAKMTLQASGEGLSGVLDRMRDEYPERFEALNSELTRWFPEFDRILFDTPGQGRRGFKLRQAVGGHAIGSHDLSQGTLLALAMFTLAYSPERPAIICFEEPDRGIHPRLLRDVRDAMYRLANPEFAGETRPPVQVIATTHSPYLVDLFRDEPEAIVVAEKDGNAAKFRRLTDVPHFEEIIADASLGDAWYTGVLGGIPARS